MKSPRFIFVTALIIAGTLIGGRTIAAESKADSKAGWQPLFNGTNLNGWFVFLKDQNERNKDPHQLVQVHDGAVHMYKDAEAGSQQPFGYIATEKEYSSYQLRLQYKWGEKKFAPRAKPTSRRDAGLLYHVVEDKVWPRSVECQIQENDVGDIFAISTRVTSPVDPKTTQLIVSTNRTSGVVSSNAVPVFQDADKGGVPFDQGSVGTSLRVVRNPMNEHEGWNTVEIIVHGDSATHLVNGKVNNRCSNIRDLVDGKWISLKKGRIALQLEGAEIFYKDVEIKELKD
jgi:hypothetical protein